MRFFELLAILCVASMVGTEFSVSAFVNPALAKLDTETWSKAVAALARVFGRFMPFWYFLGLFAIGVEAYLRRHEPSHVLIDIALVLWVIGIVYSITMLVPINNRIAKISSGTASAEKEEHRRWDVLHRWRVVLLVVAAICFMSGILVIS